MGLVYNSNDFEAFRLKLEHASKIVTSPIVSKDERQQSENLFYDLRSSKSPYEFCKYLLETSKEPYVLFQGVHTLREATIREWSLLTPELLNELQNFLMNYVISNCNSTDKYVQRQILQTISVLYKRRKLCNKTNQTKTLVDVIIELFKSSDNIEIKHICCSLMFALLNEFSNTSRSSNIGLSFSSHLNAKCLFEKSEFKQMLVFIFQVTEQLIDNNLAQNVNYRNLIMQLFTLIEQSFYWEYTSSNNILKSFIKRVDQTQAISLKPTPDFKDIFLNPNLVVLLFRSYEAVRSDNELSHICMQSIIQLSTINGPIFHDEKEAKHKYLENFIQFFIKCFSTNSIQEYEILNIASLLENLMVTFNLNDYEQLNDNFIELYFNIITQFVVNCFNAEKLNDKCENNKKYFESYEKILLSWSRLKDLKMGVLFKKYAKLILNAFIYSRLSDLDNLNFLFENGNAANSQLNMNVKNSQNYFDNESIDDDIAEDDLQYYKDVLVTLAEFARCIPEYCLPLLSKLLNEKVRRFTHTLSKLPQLTSNELNQIQSQLNSLYEDIHWLLLITGFVLFDMDADEKQNSKIPDEIMNYSIGISSYVDMNLTYNLFKNLTNIASYYDADFNFCDPLCTIIYKSFQLCELENQMHSIKLLNYMSPQVASTLQWFLKEFSKTYLFMNEKFHPQISPVLHRIFGQETECGVLIIEFLIHKIYSNFFIWSAENNVTTQTARLFNSLVSNTEICKHLYKNETFWSISKICLVNEMPWLLLPSSVKKLIIKCLIICISSNDKSDGTNGTKQKTEFLNTILTILNPLSQRFDYLFQSKHDPHTESCIKEVMNLIETYNGIIEGTSTGLVQQLFPFVLPRLQQAIELLNIYHNYGEIVELILCMFNGIIENYLYFLDEESGNQVYRTFLCLIEVFSRHNSGKRSIEANIEEDYYNDLLLFMTLLNTLQNKDVIQDLFDSSSIINRNKIENNNNNDSDKVKISSIDVVLRGLEFLIPLMNEEMLKFQALCNEYFKLISNIADTNSAKILSTSAELYSVLISSIEYGINSGSGTEIVRLCFECILSLSTYVFTNNLQETTHAAYLRKLFKSVFDMIFRNSFEIDLFDVCSSTLYTLICCFKETYNELVNDLLMQYNDEQVRNTIINGFQHLTPVNFQFNLEKKNRIKFNDRFNQFCMNVYALLFIK